MPAKSHHKAHEKTKWLRPDTSKLVKRSPNDADDAGHGGQHHQHHWVPVSQISRLPVPPPTSKKWCSGPDGPRRLVFKTVRAHDAHFGRFNGPPKCFTNPSVAWGFASKTHVNFGVVLKGGPLEKRRSNDAGSAALASASWQSQGHGLQRQPQGVARQGHAHAADPLPWKPWRRGLGVKIKVIFGRVFEASPDATECFGHEF